MPVPQTCLTLGSDCTIGLLSTWGRTGAPWPSSIRYRPQFESEPMERSLPSFKIWRGLGLTGRVHRRQVEPIAKVDRVANSMRASVSRQGNRRIGTPSFERDVVDAPCVVRDARKRPSFFDRLNLRGGDPYVAALPDDARGRRLRPDATVSVSGNRSRYGVPGDCSDWLKLRLSVRFCSGPPKRAGVDLSDQDGLKRGVHKPCTRWGFSRIDDNEPLLVGPNTGRVRQPGIVGELNLRYD